MNKLKILVIFFFSLAFLSAQTGTVRGDIFDSMTVDPLKDFKVSVLENDSCTTITDLDGAFNLDLPAGTYTVVITGDSHHEQKVKDVIVSSGKVNHLGDLFLVESYVSKKESIELGGIVVTANSRNNTETSLLKMKKKSIIMLDGISSAKMELAGDGNAVDAAKRVTGVSVEGGKYVYIRGLGDRYSKTTLNGFDIPGLDPDKNTIQMDIFPTGLMDNVMVSKNFTADQPADFTGGIMNIKTKDFPKSKFTSISFGVGYNPDMHFNNDYLTYKGGATDFLGFDNGTRDLPANALSSNLPNKLTHSLDEVVGFVKQFNSTLAPEKKTSFLNYDLSFSTGNQISLKNSTNENRRQLGYVLSLSYKNKTKFYDDVYYGQTLRNADKSKNELLIEKEQNGSLGSNNVLIGILGGLAYKTNNSKYTLNLMRLQSGEKRASKMDIKVESPSGTNSQYAGFAYNLDYNQKSLTSASLQGTHSLPESDWEIEWGIAPTFSNSEDPDIRRTPYDITRPGEFTFNAGGAGLPTRFWRNLNEFNINNKLNITKDLLMFNTGVKLKLGLSNTYKNRDYCILTYDVQFLGDQSTYFNWTGNGNEVLSDENIGTGRIYFNTSYIDDEINSNQYDANSNNIAGYASIEVKPFENLKAILGVRAEKFILKHTGRPQSITDSTQILNNKEVLNSLDFFPSANLIYEMSGGMNLRGSFSKTIARPSFKEMSFAQILDPISQVTFNGGLLPTKDWEGNLLETRINNYDLRWEYYINKNEMVSISGFYKSFDKPIELVLFSSSNALGFQPRNVGDGKVLGGEFEFRKSFDFLSSDLENLNLNANLTIVKSTIEMTDMEYIDRKQNERVGQTIDRKRDMAGQAPYIINAGLTYNTPSQNMEFGLFYNVKGETLVFVGDGTRPDVYTDPYHNLNLSLVKKLGDAVIDLKIDNILADKNQEIFKSYGAATQLFQSRIIGRTISVGYKYNF